MRFPESEPRFGPRDGNLGKVGRCIYCLADDRPLTREHVVPFGLNGPFILHDAACAECQGLTSRFELQVLRPTYGRLRQGLGMQSRRKASEFFEQEVIANGKTETRKFPAQERLALGVAFPVLASKLFFHSLIQGSELIVVGTRRIANQADLDAFCKRHGIQGINDELLIEPVAFARFIAKVGYAMAVAKYGVDAFEERFVLPAIMGRADDIGKWVAGIDASSEKPVPLGSNGKPSLHDVNIAIEAETRFVIARVRLFGGMGGPTYVVLVGRVLEDWFAKHAPEDHRRGKSSMPTTRSWSYRIEGKLSGDS